MTTPTHAINIAFGPNNQMWRFLFFTAETAKEARSAMDRAMTIGSPSVHVIDDFGQEASINLGSIHGILFECLETSAGAQIEMALMGAKNQARLNTLASADPVLRMMPANGGGGGFAMPRA